MQIRLTPVAAGALFVAALAATSGAQQGAPSRWQGFLGCWTTSPASDAMLPVVPPARLVCIAPTRDPDVAEVATVVDGKEVTARRRIDASGRQEALELKECTGTESARWSSDGRRVYLSSKASCAGVARTTSGILAMTPSGEWIDVRGISAGEGENVRVARYRDAGVPSSVPADIAQALAGSGVASQTARVADGAPVGSAAVIEASKSAIPAVVEAWLLERGQRFSLDADELLQLADAGVPGQVTDAMIAVSNPQRFSVVRNRGDDNIIRNEPAADEVVGNRIPVYMEPSIDPWGWGGYGYSRYGYGYGYGSGGYGSSLYGGNYYPGYYAPIIVVNGSGVTERPHGRMVKGHGYEPPATTGTSTSAGSASGSRAPAAESAPSRASGSSAQPEARTAKPRP